MERFGESRLDGESFPLMESFEKEKSRRGKAEVEEKAEKEIRGRKEE